MDAKQETQTNVLVEDAATICFNHHRFSLVSSVRVVLLNLFVINLSSHDR